MYIYVSCFIFFDKHKSTKQSNTRPRGLSSLDSSSPWTGWRWTYIYIYISVYMQILRRVYTHIYEHMCIYTLYIYTNNTGKMHIYIYIHVHRHQLRCVYIYIHIHYCLVSLLGHLLQDWRCLRHWFHFCGLVVFLMRRYLKRKNKCIKYIQNL